MSGFNLNDITYLMKNAAKIQEAVKKSQEEMAGIEVIGEAGAGDVKVTMNGRHYANHVKIAEAISKEDKTILEELIVSAINDATKKIERIKQKKMSTMGNFLGIDFPDDII